RITNFADIADVSIDHLHFNDSSVARSQHNTPALQQGPPASLPHQAIPSTAPPRYSAYIPSPNVPSSAPSSGVFQPQYASANGHYVKTSDSSVSLLSQFDAQGRPLKGRESLVSLQSSYDP